MSWSFQRCWFLLQNDLAGFIQNAVERPAISQIETNGELVLFETPISRPPHSANLLLAGLLFFVP